jgi:hypothetical protein
MFIMAAEDITAVMAAAVVVTVVEVEGGVRCVGDVWRREGRPDQTRGEERRGKGVGSCGYESSCIEFKCFKSGYIYLHSLSKLRKVEWMVETCHTPSYVA